MTPRVVRIDVSESRELRQRVLRPHQSLEDLAREETSAARCYGIVEEGGAVIATATVLEEQAPFALAETARRQFRLRAMATDPQHRRRGLGRALLETIVEELRASGGGLLWCSARTTALCFYERFGFVAEGTEWEEPSIGSHRYMWIILAAKTDVGTN
jgi:GNAT superfamily N-acetyltransferase